MQVKIFNNSFKFKLKFRVKINVQLYNKNDKNHEKVVKKSSWQTSAYKFQVSHSEKNIWENKKVRDESKKMK